MSIELGLQLFSVRDELEKDFVGTLEKVAKLGYKNLEFFIHDADQGMQIGGMEAKELKKLLDKLGLKAISMHVGPLNDEILDEAIPYNLEIGSSAIVYAMDFYKNKQDILDLSKKLNEYGQKCKDNGLDFYYHNHFQEFQRFDGQYALDILLNNTNKELVKAEFDTYWALRGGIDPVTYLKKLGDRCDLVHQKDLPTTVKYTSAFDTISEDEEINMDNFSQFSIPEYFTEIGEGQMDIEGIVETIRGIGSVRYIFVEQDLTTRDQMESVELSFKNASHILNP